MIDVRGLSASTLEELLDKFIQEYDKANGSPEWYTEILKKYTSGLNTVTEFGTWNGVSTICFAIANVKKIISCDINFERVDRKLITKLCNDRGIEIEFVAQNSVSGTKEFPADFVFLDTLHNYEHVKKEIERRGESAQKYLAVHDTNYPPPRKNPTKLVRDAVYEFLDGHKDFELELEDRTETGIMILKRV
jgi:cephalosporin hydroxylase